jgi:hypothetical protein
VDADMYYQEYVDDFVPSCPADSYKLQADHAGGTAYPGTNHPGANPFGGCQNDTKWGKDLLHANGGGFSSDLGTAEGYDGIANIFGFNFSGHTGFTTDITHDYTNNSNTNTYLCGTNYMPDVPIIYNTP